MEEVIAEARSMIFSHCRLADLLAFLRTARDFKPTPFNLVRVLHEAAALSIDDARKVIVLANVDLTPIESPNLEQKWRQIIDPHIADPNS
jgi:hypothetical protein